MIPTQIQDNWQQFPEAQKIIHAEQHYLQAALSTLKGSILICFNNLIEKNSLINNQIKNYWYYSAESIINLEERLIIGDYANLSLLSDTIDNFILPHILDFSEQRRDIIKEVWRCLAPEGRVVICGFNSYSLFGFPKFFKQLKESKNLLSEPQLRQLLVSEGFYIESYKTFYFRPNFSYGKDNSFTRFLETMGELLWPMMGALYFLVAQKPVLGMTPLAETKKVITAKALDAIPAKAGILGHKTRI